MKKICLSIIVILGILMSANIKVNADTVQPEVYVGIAGEVKAGSTIKIAVELKKMTNLYAASIDYTYDNSLLEVQNIVVSGNINKNVDEIYKQNASGGNKARYAYTNLGEIDGFSGDTNLIVIEAKVLKDGEVNINKENFELILVQYDKAKEGDNKISKMNEKIYYPNEAWEVVQSPAGEATYSSIESKDSVISESRIAEIEQENKVALEAAGEAAGDAPKEATENNDPEAEVVETKDEKAKEEDKDYTAVGIIGLIVVAGAGFFIYKKKSLNKDKVA